ncbi:hypothetical protein [Kocuria sabuli]|uniref:hypothetical protein n=1 Tax=Kocuria sabuli TaxID=3071448 RepID=UPI0034D409F6
MERFSRCLILGFPGVGIFSIIVPGFFDLIDGQLLEGLAMIFFGAFIGAGGLKFDRDCLRPR